MAEEFKFPDEGDVDVDLDNDIELEIVDDTPEKDKGRRPLDKPVDDPTDEELAAYTEGVQKRIKELTHARHDERRAKEAIQRERDELEQATRRLLEENSRFKTAYAEGSKQYAETARTAAQAELEMAKRQFKEAYESGDPDRVIEAQEKLTEAKMRSEAAKNFTPAPLQSRETEVQVPQGASSAPRLDEKTLRWQAKNQWFGQPGYEEITSFSLGLHTKLVNSGVDPRSDEYYERIDARLKATFPEVFSAARDTGDSAPSATSNVGRKPSTVVAPATRSTGARKVRLTQTQLQLAKRFGLTPQQYAVELAKVEKANG